MKIDDQFYFRADGSNDYRLLGNVIAGQNGSYFSYTGNNAVVKDFKGGSYTFDINYRIDHYGDKAYGIGVDSFTPDGATKWKMVGNGSLWTGDFVYANGLTMEPTSSANTEVKILEEMIRGTEVKKK